MAIKQPICLECLIEMQVIANDISFIVSTSLHPNNVDDEARSYNGDIWQCKKCKGIIATGFGTVVTRLPERVIKWTDENTGKYIAFKDILGGPLQEANKETPGVVCCKCKSEMQSECKIDVVHMEENRSDNKKVLDATASGWRYICTECGVGIAIPTEKMKTAWDLRVSNAQQTKNWLLNRHYVIFTRRSIAPELVESESKEPSIGSILGISV